MTDLGKEVGQKMRSAIKAKLMELDCYVDDELPDYIMVMVANKRTKSQMNTDLRLFLTNKTSTFVDWLHIVLKKLKEVHVTNPEVYKKVTKRKVVDEHQQQVIEVKREKKEKSLTDDLPVSANKLAEVRKIVLIQEKNQSNQDSFDIPLLSEVETIGDLESIEKRIKSVKNRLGLTVESEEEQEDEDFINLKTDAEELFPTGKSVNQKDVTRKIIVEEEERSFTPELEEHDKVQKNQTTKKHAKITFENSTKQDKKMPSVLSRLGKRTNESSYKEVDRSKRQKTHNDNQKRQKETITKSSNVDIRSKLNEKRNNEKNALKSRLGVLSKVEIPVKRQIEEELTVSKKEVSSVVKVKPRIIPPGTKQANKNLLLKAVAEAQKSIIVAQTAKNRSKKEEKEHSPPRKEKSHPILPNKEKNKIISILDNNSNVSKVNNGNNNNVQTVKQQFIVTLDGLDKEKYGNLVKSDVSRKKTPSPIIFESGDNKNTNPVELTLPLPLPTAIQVPSITVKSKEKCKYWPACRLGNKCEYHHPKTNCKTFPLCKYGDKCLFIHPPCKFEASCTRRDCPYSHSKTPATLTQVCKYFPHCVNVQCAYYHPPKPCKFGKFCQNQEECNFSHTFSNKKINNLTWRSEENKVI